MASYCLELTKKELERIKKLNDADKQQIGLLNYRVEPIDNRMVMCDEDVNGRYNVLQLGSNEAVLGKLCEDNTVKRVIIQYGVTTSNWIRRVATLSNMTLFLVGQDSLICLVLDI